MRRLAPALFQPLLLLGISVAQPLDEFTLGFLNPWHLDYRLLAAMVLCDIEHRKSYEPDLVARFGPQIFPVVNTSAYRPTLRIRPVAAESGARQDVGVLAAMNFVTGVPGRYPPVDGFIGEITLSVLIPVGAIGAAYKVNHLTAPNAEDFSDKNEFPYFFRLCPPGSLIGRVMWSYFTFFGFRAAAFLYSSNEQITPFWNVMLAQAAAAKRDKALTGIGVRDTASRQTYIEEAEWTAAMARVNAAKVRLVFLCPTQEMQATFGTYVVTTLGLRAPAFQVVGENLLVNQRVWHMELNTFHAVVVYFRDADTRLLSFLVQYLSLNVTDIVGFMDRYGLSNFRRARFEIRPVLHQAVHVPVRAARQPWHFLHDDHDVQCLQRLRVVLRHAAQSRLPPLSHPRGAPAQAAQELDAERPWGGHRLQRQSGRRGRRVRGVVVPHEQRHRDPIAEVDHVCPLQHRQGGRREPQLHDPLAAQCQRRSPPLPGARSCQNCGLGSAAGGAGADRCAACPLGAYAALQSQTACSPCQRGPPASGVGLSTLFPGGTSEAACACPAGAYEPAASPGTCTPCPGGVECGFGTTLVAQGRRLANDSGSLGWKGPQAKPGYMLQPEDPLGAYLCIPAAFCPGGPPGACNNGRLGPACGACPDGTADAGVADCLPCTDGANALAAFFWVGIVVLAVLVYYVGNGPITFRSTPLIGIAASVSALLMTTQVVGIFKRLSSPFPKSSGELVGASAVLLFDWRTLIPLPCMVRSAWKSYIVNVVGFPLVCLSILGCWLLSVLLVRAKLLPDRFPYLWEWDKALNAVGAFLQATFIIMASTAAIPMICYRHPNGKSSVAKLPAVLCGDSEHQGMLSLGILLMLFASAYYALILHLLATAPKRLKQLGPISFFRRMRFLVLLFNLERYYWAAVVSLRSLSLALVPVFIPNSAHGQQLLLAGILLAYAVAVDAMWPWKVPILNLLDTLSCAMLVLVLMMSGVSIPAEMEKPGGLDVAMTVLIALQYSASFPVLVGSVVAVCARGRFALLFEPFLLRWRLDVDTASRNLLGAASALLAKYGDDAVTLARRVENWQYQDIRVVEKVVDVLIANGEVRESGAARLSGRLSCEMDPVALSALSSGHLGSADSLQVPPPVVLKERVLRMAIQTV